MGQVRVVKRMGRTAGFDRSMSTFFANSPLGVAENSFAGTGILSQILFESRKLAYLYDAVWKDRSYFQLTRHRLNE